MSLHPADDQDDKSRRPSPQPTHTASSSWPRYQVVLHNSWHDTMFVVRTIMEVTRFCLAEATRKMTEANQHGRALLLVTYKERAELYVEQFAERGLTATIEPA